MNTKGIVILTMCVLVAAAGVFGLSRLLQQSAAPQSSNVLTAPGAIEVLTVLDAKDKVLWKAHRTSNAEIDHLAYGVQGGDVIQDVPELGDPRLLIPGEELTIRFETEDWWCRHKGHADAPKNFEGGYWECGPTDSPVTTKGFGPRARPRL